MNVPHTEKTAPRLNPRRQEARGDPSALPRVTCSFMSAILPLRGDSSFRSHVDLFATQYSFYFLFFKIF